MNRYIRIAAVSAGFFVGLAPFAGAMGRVPKKEYLAKADALNECRNEAQSLTEKTGTLAARVDALEKENGEILANLEAGKNDLQKRVAELLREKQEVEKEKARVEEEKAKEVQKLKGTYDSLVSDMEKEIQQGSIQITRLRDKLSVNLIDKILFDSGEAAVNKQGEEVLDKVANVLKKVQDKQIRIEGHTDNVRIGGALKETFPTNWELSAARATTVTRYLQDKGGIDPKLLSAAGYSEYRPIADNGAPEGRSKNRRIEITLVPLETAAAAPIPEPPKNP
ncbi:MAG: hypothetical protein A2902_00710 [Elusimicrobia bacterium RIFCSPLOWO2_01_FULL_64_13]|nr:MAG: hypothetical protein A2902_00710 [Elusimicrobia bacterium RIFCSPLOWO2_01_FULL_64_13]